MSNAPPQRSPLSLLPPGGRGPFFTSIFAAIIPCIVILIFRTGVKVSVYTFFGLIIPGTAITAVLVAVSMGWIFVMVGRLKKRPDLIPATMVLLAVAMVAMLFIIYIAGETQVPATGF